MGPLYVQIVYKNHLIVNVKIKIIAVRYQIKNVTRLNYMRYSKNSSGKSGKPDVCVAQCFSVILCPL